MVGESAMDESNKRAGIMQKVIVALLIANLLATGILGFYTVSRIRGIHEIEEDMDNMYDPTEKYTIYIGLNDKDTYEQTESAAAMWMVIPCRQRRAAGWMKRTS